MPRKPTSSGGSPLWRGCYASSIPSAHPFCAIRHSLIRPNPLKRGMNSNIVALQGCVPAFLGELDSLADMANTLYALFRLAETQPESFDTYRQLALSQAREGNLPLKFVLKAWPGRATADALRLGAETLLAELNHYPLADGAVLCANTLLDNLRIVGGLYVTANQRDPATFRRCTDQRVVDHWLNAVCESQVEYPEVLESLQNHVVPRVVKAGTPAGRCLQP